MQQRTAVVQVSEPWVYDAATTALYRNIPLREVMLGFAEMDRDLPYYPEVLEQRARSAIDIWLIIQEHAVRRLFLAQDQAAGRPVPHAAEFVPRSVIGFVHRISGRIGTAARDPLSPHAASVRMYPLSPEVAVGAATGKGGKGGGNGEGGSPSSSGAPPVAPAGSAPAAPLVQNPGSAAKMARVEPLKFAGFAERRRDPEEPSFARWNRLQITGGAYSSVAGARVMISTRPIPTMAYVPAYMTPAATVRTPATAALGFVP